MGVDRFNISRIAAAVPQALPAAFKATAMPRFQSAVQHEVPTLLNPVQNGMHSPRANRINYLA